MKLKNVLIVSKNLERSIRFYKTLFGLQVVLRQEGNVILTEGLVLQEASVWAEAIGREIIWHNHAALLYFEESDIDGFQQRLLQYEEAEGALEILLPLKQIADGQRIMRFFDPDGNLIEVRSKIER